MHVLVAVCACIGGCMCMYWWLYVHVLVACNKIRFSHEEAHIDMFVKIKSKTHQKVIVYATSGNWY